MDRDFHRFDCVKSFGSPLGIKGWNTHKIKVRNVKGILARGRMKSSSVGRGTCRGVLPLVDPPCRGFPSAQQRTKLLQAGLKNLKSKEINRTQENLFVKAAF